MDLNDDVLTEEMYVLVEFAGNMGDDALKQENVSIKITGIDSDQPLVQIGNQLYAGEFSETFGTELIFTEVDNTKPVDPVFETKLEKRLAYVAKTSKKLVIKRAFATQKTPTESNEAAAALNNQDKNVS